MGNMSRPEFLTALYVYLSSVILLGTVLEELFASLVL